jgi:hypothetical protein
MVTKRCRLSWLTNSALVLVYEPNAGGSNSTFNLCVPVRELVKMYVAFLKSLKKEVRSTSQRYGSADPDPDPDTHQNVTDTQHWLRHTAFHNFIYSVVTDLQGVKVWNRNIERKHSFMALSRLPP